MIDPAQDIWNKRYKARGMVSPPDFTLKAFTYLKNRPAASLLDIGCGDGRDSLFFAKKGLRVTAIDFSEKAIQRLQQPNPDIDARVMDIKNLQWENASFDAVYAHLSLHYFDNATTDAIFRNIFHILKQNGYFFVKCKSTKDPLYGQGKRVGENIFIKEYQRHFFSLEYMENTLRNFHILELSETRSMYDGKESCFVEAIAQKTADILPSTSSAAPV